MNEYTMCSLHSPISQSFRKSVGSSHWRLYASWNSTLSRIVHRNSSSDVTCHPSSPSLPVHGVVSTWICSGRRFQLPDCASRIRGQRTSTQWRRSTTTNSATFSTASCLFVCSHDGRDRPTAGSTGSAAMLNAPPDGSNVRSPLPVDAPPQPSLHHSMVLLPALPPLPLLPRPLLLRRRGTSNSACTVNFGVISVRITEETSWRLIRLIHKGCGSPSTLYLGAVVNQLARQLMSHWSIDSSLTKSRRCVSAPPVRRHQRSAVFSLQCHSAASHQCRARTSSAAARQVIRGRSTTDHLLETSCWRNCALCLWIIQPVIGCRPFSCLLHGGVHHSCHQEGGSWRCWCPFISSDFQLASAV